ncbi:Uncharacterized protein GBIM_11063 [Gryllus bimaculatus]|nr:Uncharacterized protein GBIM_11063 [Gryllus bimaculatus]
MNSFLSLLEEEAPEKRVFEWLKHCSAAPKDVEYSREDSGCLQNERNETELTANFRLRNKSCVLKLYSREECQHIITYIVENDAFPFLKGTLLWQKMENEKVCYRSWQSMKEQFIKKIYPNLGEYPVKPDDRKKFMEYMKPSPPQKIIHMEPGQRGWRKNGRYYTIEEDLIILKYIFHRRRHLQVHGNSLWQTMEDRQILPGRTWQSMRSRYLNVIRHSLDEYKSQDTGIKSFELHEKGKAYRTRKFFSQAHSRSKKKKKKSNVSVYSPLSSCTNTKKLVSRKVANQQDIRKYAISTGTQLASKLKVLGKNMEHLKHHNKEMQPTSCSLVYHEASDSEAPAVDQQNTSEKNKKNKDMKRKEVECSISCNISSVLPDLQNDAASTNESVGESDNSNKKSDQCDRTVENSRSGVNSHDCSSISCESLKKIVKHPPTLVNNRSSEKCENSNNEDRNNVECSIPDHISDLQEFVSDSEICDMAPSCNANHSQSEGQVIDDETRSEISRGKL